MRRGGEGENVSLSFRLPSLSRTRGYRYSTIDSIYNDGAFVPVSALPVYTPAFQSIGQTHGAFY